LITCDYYLYRFDRRPAKDSSYGCVLLPNTFWQIIRPLIPNNENFDRAFAETFALPELRTIQSQSAKAGSRMLSVLASFADVPEETAIRMLSNGLLLRKLRAIDDDTKFEEAVEKAFVEENRTLLEEREAKDRVIAESEKLLAQKEEEIIALKQGKEREASHAERLLIDNKIREENLIRDRQEAEKKAERTGKLASILVSFIIAVLFQIGIRVLFPWRWLLNHPNSYGLQGCFFLIVFTVIPGLWIRSWRKVLLSAGLVGAILVGLQLIGGPPKSP
jgi:hypothetical protein